MKVGDKVIFIDSDGEEHLTTIEFVVPRAKHPVADPGFDLSNFDQTRIGGGPRDEESYLISVPNPDYRPDRDRKKMSLLWPKLSRIKYPSMSSVTPKATKTRKGKNSNL